MSKSAHFLILDKAHGSFDPQRGVISIEEQRDGFQGVTPIFFDWENDTRHYHDDGEGKLIAMGMGRPIPPMVNVQVNIRWDELGSWWQLWKNCVAGIAESKIRPVKIADFEGGQFPSHQGIWLHGCRIYAIFPLTEDNLFEAAQLAIKSTLNQQTYQLAVQMLLYYASLPDPTKHIPLFIHDDPSLIAQIIRLFQGHRKFREQVGEDRLAGFALRVNQAVNAGL